MASEMTALFFLLLMGYGLCMGLLMAYALGQFYLSRKALKAKAPQCPPIPLEAWPLVVVQAPVYNERYVVAGLIDALCGLDYPKDKLYIQILDDSTDDTTEIIDLKCEAWRSLGAHIEHLHRTHRKGYKAGALQAGLQKAKGAFVAIFDADFLPDAGFLKHTIPHFQDPKVGMVQTRWGHINRSENLLTRLQSFGLDTHFAVEQRGRQAAQVFFNFNGTAGVWRTEAIRQGGGWQSDTLTEDLDLSYRVQLAGWKFVYLHSEVAPAELPPQMPGLKSQQYRWTKGAAQCARKHLKTIWLHPGLSLRMRWHASLHLANSAVFVLVFLSALLSLGLFYFMAAYPQLGFARWMQPGWVFAPTLVILAYTYRTGNKQTTLMRYIFDFFLFLSFYLGLSLHIGKAVVSGLITRGGTFERTPKGRGTQNRYYENKKWLNVLPELLLSVVFAWITLMSIQRDLYGFLLLFAMMTLGFAAVAFYNIKALLNRR
jgi:cellulose synthase/poly-beta-1,6-N-acetylglucosamine synthase-like glycosyltransferase